MGNEEDRTAIADLKARMSNLEKEVEEIKEEQKNSRDDRQRAALREKDLGMQMELLSKDIQDHIRMHENEGSKKARGLDIVLAVGMLVTAALSAYGAVAMIAITKAVTK